MDRTQASDAFNAGSIPVGCILICAEGISQVGMEYEMDKKKKNNRQNVKQEKKQQEIKQTVKNEEKKTIIPIA